MNTRKVETLAEPDLSDPAVQAEIETAHLEYQAYTLPDKYLKDELMKRGYIVQDNTEYDEATGLLKWKGDTPYYFTDDATRRMVSGEEAYKRASGGW